MKMGPRGSKSNYCTGKPTNHHQLEPSELNHILIHFSNRWRDKYLTNLRESHNASVKNSNKPTIKKNDVVIKK